METYKNQRIAESAPVLAAASRLEQAEAGLQRIKEGATVDDAAIFSAVTTNTRLQTELEAARQKAQAAFAAKKAAVQKELDAFWQRQHSNGFRYDQLLDASCNPQRTHYGVMKSAAAELCPRLQAIQRKMPDVKADPEVQRIEAELAALAPALSLHRSMESAKLAVSQAEEELHSKQSTSGIANGTDVYPPVFHRLANLTSGNITADNLVSVFGLLGILLLLFSLNLFQEARLLCMQDSDGNIRQDAETEAQSWMSKLMFWRQDKPATVTPAPVSAHAATAQAPAAVAPTVPTVDMPPAQPRDDDDGSSRFGFMGTVGGLKATARNEAVRTETKVVFRDRERVPPELSQKKAGGRAGKIDVCIDCSSDYEVKVHNALRCPACAEARQNKGRNIYQRTKKSDANDH
jgi:DNA-directed RNA polymerase subunit RPC12/RpoP